jgi:hypothetical protein
MTRSILIGMIMLLACAYSPVCQNAKTSLKVGKDTTDTSQYDIIIVDLKFDQWYITNFNEAKDHTNDYYRTFDRIAVPRWNEYFREGKYESVIDCYIEYWPDIDYGLNVNRKLYWYFKYIESNYGIRLL